MTQQQQRPTALPEFLQGEGVLIDVRSPAEFEQGHIPGSVNLPLLDDHERAVVGTAYKHNSREQAVLLGLGFVGQRLEALARDLLHHSRGSTAVRLYCWRGGQRSGSVAWLAGTLGLNTCLLSGGYKGFRRWVLSQFERPWPLLVLAGRTGVGKTDVLQALQQQGSAVVDLEGLACHRGSSFGGLGLPAQPSSEHFENLLARNLEEAPPHAAIWIEAESAQVGRCRLPGSFWKQMQQATVVELVRPLHERLDQLVQVYGSQEPEALRAATERISRRLGPQRTTAALAAIDAGDMATACAQMLDYYDRCYDHELANRQQAPVLQIDGGGLMPAQLAQELGSWERRWWNQGRPRTLA